MYRVYAKNKDEDVPIYEPIDDELRLFSTLLSRGAGTAGTFSFQIHTEHPNFDKLKVFESEIIVYNDSEVIFYGRMMRPQHDFDNIVTILCEGELTYLLDSMQRPLKYSGSVDEFIRQLLAVHNSQTEERRRIYPGNFIVGSDRSIEIETTDFSPTLTVLRNQLMEPLGGYFRIRHAGEKRILDYVWDYGGINEQTIRFAENLLDLTKYVDASQLVTCLIPEGADIEYQDKVGEIQTKAVSIASVNNGQDFIRNENAVALYGSIWGYHKFEDVTEPEVLLERAKKYLEQSSALPTTIEISAIDLALIDKNVQEFKVGYWTNVSSGPHKLEHRFMMTKIEIDLLDPTSGTITLGRKIETLTEMTIKSETKVTEKIKKVSSSTSKEINRKVENATKLITGGLGGYVVLDNLDPSTGEKMHPWRILIMNTPDKETAKNVIQFNQNGIGFSTTGINGPYSNAWTIDGNLVADFITAGTMLSDRIRGGTLELGGSGLGKDGKIVVKNADGKQIGYWDKTGLYVGLGTIEGTNIRGGTINIGNGTFQVDRDGSVSIESGEISIGPVTINDNIVDFGSYRVASAKEGVIYSRDQKIQIWTSHPDWDGRPIIQVGSTLIGDRFVRTKAIDCDDVLFSDPWTENMTALEMFKQLYYRINQLGG